MNQQVSFLPFTWGINTSSKNLVSSEDGHIFYLSKWHMVATAERQKKQILFLPEPNFVSGQGAACCAICILESTEPVTNKARTAFTFTGMCSNMKPQHKIEWWILTLLFKLLSYIASPSLANIYSFRCGSVLFRVRSLCYKPCLPTVHECLYNQMWCFELFFLFCHDLNCDLSHFTVPFLMD